MAPTCYGIGGHPQMTIVFLKDFRNANKLLNLHAHLCAPERFRDGISVENTIQALGNA